MKDDLKTARTVSGLAAFLAFAPLLIWRAFVLATLWGWFLTPLAGVAPPSIPVAIGLLVTWTIFSSSKPSENGKTPDEVYTQLAQFIANGIGVPLLALLVGAVARGFV